MHVPKLVHAHPPRHPSPHLRRHRPVRRHHAHARIHAHPRRHTHRSVVHAHPRRCALHWGRRHAVAPRPVELRWRDGASHTTEAPSRCPGEVAGRRHRLRRAVQLGLSHGTLREGAGAVYARGVERVLLLEAVGGGSRSGSGWLVGVGLLVFEVVVEGSWVVVKLGPFVHLESRGQRKAGRRRREGI